mmetsp:Transcript_4400/g.5836  ORF Transcript_4400/g.5836 Transcript_4400/m.5836 type:complete len:91 (+) Transcript_4400:147-419(+)
MKHHYCLSDREPAYAIQGETIEQEIAVHVANDTQGICDTKLTTALPSIFLPPPPPVWRTRRIHGSLLNLAQSPRSCWPPSDLSACLPATL